MLPDEEVIARIVEASRGRRECDFHGSEVSGAAFSRAIKRVRHNDAARIRGARVFGSVSVENGDVDVRFSKCTFDDISFIECVLKKITFTDCGAQYVSLNNSQINSLNLANSNFDSLLIISIGIVSAKFSGSTFGIFSLNDVSAAGSFSLNDVNADVIEVNSVNFGRSVHVDSTNARKFIFRSSAIDGDFFIKNSTYPEFDNSYIYGHAEINLGQVAEQFDLFSQAPFQVGSPLSLAVDHGHFGPAPAPESGNARLSGMESAHAQVRDSVGGALREFDGGNRPRLADLIRNYLTCLGDCAEAVDEVGLGFAAVRLEAQAKHLFEDGMDLLVGEKRAALEELLAVHRHFEGQLSQWKEFRERARESNISEDDAAMVAQAAEPLAAGMVKAPDAFAPELPERLRELAEATREPGASQPEVSYGVSQGIANTVNYLAGFVLRVMRKTGKKTTDRLEEELSDEASEKLAKAARLLLRASAKYLLPLSGIPMFEWVGRVLRFFAEEDGEK